MPHSTRSKRPSALKQKRLTLTDDDGWSHVTTGGNARRTVRGTKATATAKAHTDAVHTSPILSPAEAPARLTLDELQAQYAAHREQWTASETWRKLEKVLDERVQGMRGTETEAGAEAENCADVDRIVCIGLGSLSGFSRDGWVDRRSVSMYQLAALERIKERVASLNTSTASSTPTTIPVYAQDPVFNSLDRALLESMGITVVEHPVAFENVTRNTLLFCPGAERQHLELILPSNPGFVFGGPLENTQSDVIEGFVERVGSQVLELFTVNEHAFWSMRLYFREEEAV
ncbi:Sensitivity To Red Light Reduced-like SRR1 [Penicillium verhagenii]|nr:Sensitivity To Red Light Reduced-like SRR1 [Penicillium verhagenii]